MYSCLICILFSGKKTPKDDAMVIDELRQQNDDLRSHILQLLKENETQATDISMLMVENNRLTEQLARHTHNDVTHTGSPSHVFTASDPGAPQSGELAGIPAHSEPIINHKWSKDEEKTFYDDLYAHTGVELPPLQMPNCD